MKSHSKITKQFARYFGAALVGYIVDLVTLVILHDVLGVHYLVSAAVGFLLGLLVLYSLSVRYVFGKSKLNSRGGEFALFALIGLVGLGILAALMWLLTDVAGINYLVSKILATVFVYLWNFFARRKLYRDVE